MYKYEVEFTQDGKRFRVKIDADSEYYARKKVIDKCKSSPVNIESCVIFKKKNDNVVDFLSGFFGMKK